MIQRFEENRQTFPISSRNGYSSDDRAEGKAA